MKHKTLSLLTLIGLLLPATGKLSAQTTDAFIETLKRVSSVKIAAAPVGDYGKRCGLSESAIEAFVRTKVDGSRIRISEEGPEVLLVRTTSLYFADSDQCVSSVNTDIYGRVMNIRTKQEGATSLTSQTGIVSGSSVTQLSQVQEMVGRQVTQIISDWIRANPRP